jgi:hypothetical protein
MHVYDELANATDSPVKYVIKENCRIGMDGYKSCLSISMREFDYICTFVKENKPQRAFEVGTAIGISAISFALGMKEYGGIIATLDPFVEEFHDDGNLYLQGHTLSGSYEDSKGWESVNYLIDRYGLEDNLVPVMGWSPQDVPWAMERVFGGAPLDVFFCDGGHSDEFAMRDLKAVLPFLNNRRAVFFHDWHMLSENFHAQAQNLLGHEVKVIPGCEFPGAYFLALGSTL